MRVVKEIALIINIALMIVGIVNIIMNDERKSNLLATVFCMLNTIAIYYSL